MGNIEFNRELNILGLRCPSCALELVMELGEMQEGETLKVISDDPSTTKDFPRVLEIKGHELLSQSENDKGDYIYFVRCGSK